MSEIASSNSAATTAVANVKSVTIEKGKQVVLSESTIASMKTGMEVNNQLLSDLAQLVECTITQSEKFPKIAELIALQDSQIEF
ncbi:hypothetical protein [Listeria welshimeri]|uniref:hypothetical protein n=1 Tax=Listeria welshimeri TaxID=1643 RepID=UPI001889A484|nr:hypothetical protein [Listeria welshimeri]MBF2622319.1 hypothetical protein [Listeria welshimeri]